MSWFVSEWFPSCMHSWAPLVYFIFFLKSIPSYPHGHLLMYLIQELRMETSQFVHSTHRFLPKEHLDFPSKCHKACKFNKLLLCNTIFSLPKSCFNYTLIRLGFFTWEVIFLSLSSGVQFYPSPSQIYGF